MNNLIKFFHLFHILKFFFLYLFLELLTHSSQAQTSGGLPPLIKEKESKAISKIKTLNAKDCNDCPVMIYIPEGKFIMGSEDFKEQIPDHTVHIDAFFMGRTEVTQSEWLSVMGFNPSYFNKCGLSCPVESVKYSDALLFAEKLSLKTGKHYRLPSEAEWEYAAKAGTNTKWSFGSDRSKLEDYAWFANNSDFKTHVVGSKLPNLFGLYDMHGNVLEWVEDNWHEDYIGAPIDGKAWISVVNTDEGLMRGGAWCDLNGNFLRSDYRDRHPLRSSGSYVSGLRIARAL